MVVKPMRGILGGVPAAAVVARVSVMLAAGVVPAAADTGAAVSGGTWGSAQQIPGLAALSNGGASDLRGVSCGAPGYCSAAGGYTTSAGRGQAFVANEINGTWGTAQKVPGLATLNQGHNAEVYTLSCASAGNCAAGGYYHDGAGHHQAFVVSETNGTWHNAEEVPGTAALNTGGAAAVLSVSCASAGNCSAGGYYRDGAGEQQVFVVSQVGGVWGTAEEVPGTAVLNQGGFAEVYSVSCGAVGNCSAGGFYLDTSPRHQAFVVNETHGVWGTAQEVPGTAALNPRGDAVLSSLSCAAAGTCTGGGQAGAHPFVVSETNGIWGSAEIVPGIAAINNGRPAEVDRVSCASAGNCSASGSYIYGTNQSSVFVATKTNGTWGTAQQVPGFAVLNQAGNALPYALSCGAPGNCATGGYYQQGSTLHPFVANQVKGIWRTAREVPGIAALTHGLALLWSVSCASAGNCSAGGNYNLNTSHQQAFVVTETT